MNIGNITSDNFNLDGNGKDIQIEVYEQLIEQLQQENQELKRKLNETIHKATEFESEVYELKKQLEDLQETHYLIQGGRSNGKTYLMKLQADKEQLNSLVNSCQEEIRRLKKQLEEKNNPQIFIDTQDMEERYAEGLYQEHLEKENIKYKNQQKEFINYLEDEIKRINPKELDIGELNLRLNDIKFTQYLIYKEILQKYKEIIGGKE